VPVTPHGDLAAAVAAAIDPDRVAEITAALCAAKQPNGDQEEERARVLAALLEETPGVDVELDWVLPDRPNLLARVRGRGEGPGLLLNGHLDASYHPVWSRDPHEPWIEDGRIYGAAVTDMLGGVGSMAAAIEAVAKLGPPPGDVVFLASMHHDTIGLGVKYALASENDLPRFGICGEPTQLAIHTANGGAVKFRFLLEGQLAHVSRLDEGVDALAAAVDLCVALRGLQLTHEPHPQLPDLPLLHVGQVESGMAPGAVADAAMVAGDIRTLPSMTRDVVRADLERVAEEVIPADVPWRLELTAVQRSYIGPESGALLDALSDAHAALLGDRPEVTTRMPVQAFVTDTADMQALGVESLIYGPADWHYVPDENVAIEELAAAARVYALLGLRFGG
jgi:acetylornithine deacetylase/succinyl-diaminopimelate desuccinylase-like protein